MINNNNKKIRPVSTLVTVRSVKMRTENNPVIGLSFLMRIMIHLLLVITVSVRLIYCFFVNWFYPHELASFCRCGFMNFASNRNCLRCRVARPKRQLNPGEWECPSWVSLSLSLSFAHTHTHSSFQISILTEDFINTWVAFCRCDFLNYRKNMVCLKCNCERPKEAAAASEYEEQLWKRPH